MKRKLPILISLGNGQMGRFIKKEPTGDSGLVNIYYHPYGLMGLFKKDVIRNVPDSAVIEITNLPGAGEDGVPLEGYVFLLAGENGNRYLSKKLGLFLDKNIDEINKELKKYKIKEKSHKIEQIKAASGIKEELREVAERDKILKREKNDEWKSRLNRLDI